MPASSACASTLAYARIDRLLHHIPCIISLPQHLIYIYLQHLFLHASPTIDLILAKGIHRDTHICRRLRIQPSSASSYPAIRVFISIHVLGAILFICTLLLLAIDVEHYVLRTHDRYILRHDRYVLPVCPRSMPSPSVSLALSVYSARPTSLGPYSLSSIGSFSSIVSILPLGHILSYGRVGGRTLHAGPPLLPVAGRSIPLSVYLWRFLLSSISLSFILSISSTYPLHRTQLRLQHHRFCTAFFG